MVDAALPARKSWVRRHTGGLAAMNGHAYERSYVAYKITRLLACSIRIGALANAVVSQQTKQPVDDIEIRFEHDRIRVQCKSGRASWRSVMVQVLQQVEEDLPQQGLRRIEVVVGSAEIAKPQLRERLSEQPNACVVLHPLYSYADGLPLVKRWKWAASKIFPNALTVEDKISAVGALLSQWEIAGRSGAVGDHLAGTRGLFKFLGAYDEKKIDQELEEKFLTIHGLSHACLGGRLICTETSGFSFTAPFLVGSIPWAEFRSAVLAISSPSPDDVLDLIRMKR